MRSHCSRSPVDGCAPASEVSPLDCMASTSSAEFDVSGCNTLILHHKTKAGAHTYLPHRIPQRFPHCSTPLSYESRPAILASTLYTIAKSSFASPMARATVRNSLLMAVV